MIPGATPCSPGPSARPSCGARRARPGPPSPTSPRWPVAICPSPRPTGAGGRCSPAVARGRCPGPWSSRGRPPPSTSWPASSTPSGATTCTSSCGITATRSTRPATTPSSPWPAGSTSASWPPATSTTRSPSRRPLATALAAVRARRSLDEIDGWLPGGAGAHLRSGHEQRSRFARYPGAVEAAALLGRACAFDLSLVAPQLPPFPCPAGLSEMAFLRRVVEEGARTRYGPRGQRAGPRRLRPGRPRARPHRAARVPRLLPHRVGPGALLP